LLAKGGRRLWSALLELKAGGLIQKLGVSVYHPRQLENILNQNQIDLVQLPFNVYDQRFAQSGLLSRLTKMRIEVHARSVFLQGLLLMPPDQLPDGFRAIRTHHAKLHDQFRELGITPLQGALLYCLRQPAIDRIVVGCETADQLKVVLQACGEKMVAELPDLARFGLENDVIINPSVWRQ
jgi:aryl-alcohol dehydrogenase-like predicted oxidoreductase